MVSFPSMPASLPAMALLNLPAIAVEQALGNSAHPFQNLIALQKSRPAGAESNWFSKDELECQDTAPQCLSSIQIKPVEAPPLQSITRYLNVVIKSIDFNEHRPRYFLPDNGEPESETIKKSECDQIILPAISAMINRDALTANDDVLDTALTPKAIGADFSLPPGAQEARLADVPIPKIIVASPTPNAIISTEFQAALALQITASPPACPQQNFTDRQLDLARDTLWLGQLAHDIVTAREGNDRLSFRLIPEILGRMDVNLAASDTGLNMQIKTSGEDAAVLVAAAQPRLIDELRAHGIRVTAADVTHGELSQHGKGTYHPAAAPFTETNEFHQAETSEIQNAEIGGRFA